jgi:ubiquinone/menaquinone biosynthesis C-methylase UbiE
MPPHLKTDRQNLTSEQWQEQFRRQEQWTRELRHHLFRSHDITSADMILDVGCGSGEITRDTQRICKGRVYGFDIDKRLIHLALKETPPLPYFFTADAYSMPFPDDTFDVVYCHLLLFWLEKPGNVLEEMQRVTRDGGYILILCEPDYGGWIMNPEMPELRKAIIQSMLESGLNPYFGRQLAGVCSDVGLKPQLGIHPSVWDIEKKKEEFSADWWFIKYTASHLMVEEDLICLIEIERETLKKGKFFSYIPYFYVISKVRR